MPRLMRSPTTGRVHNVEPSALAKAISLAFRLPAWDRRSFWARA